MFQRLVAIPQEEYLNMSTLRNVQQPIAQYFQNLQKQRKKTAYYAQENKA